MHFKPKLVGDGCESENKNYRSVLFHSIPTQRIIENFKKIAKKLKNTIMDLFEAEIGCKRM